MTTFKIEEFDTLVYWIAEREAIRRRRANGNSKPWTTDSLLRDYKWCNVRRLDDAVSRSLFNSWYSGEGFAMLTPQSQLVAATLARLFNWPPTLMHASYGGPYVECGVQCLPSMLKRTKQWAAKGNKTFTGAYIVPSFQTSNTKLTKLYDNKIDAVFNLAEVMADADAPVRDMMQRTWSSLMQYDGIGSFIAGQIVADLAHLPAGLNWPDRDTWAPLGPGSARGINRLRGIQKDKPVMQEHFNAMLPSLIKQLRSVPRIDEIWCDRNLQAMDIQNCLCEYDKYRRLQLGEGTVRALYNGRPSDDLFKG